MNYYRYLIYKKATDSQILSFRESAAKYHTMRFKQIPVILFMGIILSSCFRNAPQIPKKILLHDNWTFQKAGSDSTYPARVPGCVHLDLMDNGLIPDPFFGENEKNVQWIEKKDWVYQTRFRAGSQLLSFGHIDLVFEGLDTYATVYLNGEEILRADNMFRTWQIDVKNKLHRGQNELKVVFRSPVMVNRDKASTLPYTLPDERAFTRKAPYMFGWDWGPRLVTSGIWKPVYFETWNEVKFGNWKIITDSLGEDKAKLRLIMKVNANDSMKLDCKCKVSRNERKTIPVDLVPGENTLVFPFEIDAPKLWWTHNLGEPFLYDFSLSLNEGEKVVEQLRDKFGIRTIELITDKDDHGRGFYFKLNGVPVFMKGANYIPQDNFPTRVNWEGYEKLVRDARDANMNMLRVWGGGIYENDAFYKLCDEYGIMVWQDFMFACAMYPGDPSFIENVNEEAEQQVLRLRNHPCLALWCGNNEIDEGWHNWGWQKQFGYSKEDSANIWSGYLKVFHEVLPEAVKRFDGQTAYWPSSPKHGWGRKESLTDGDMHYWGVWWGREPFEIYNQKIGRFMSEYGFQGYPVYATLEQVIPENERYVGSATMLNHQKHPFGEEVIRDFMGKSYILPPKDRVEEYIYLSQLVQAYGMKTAVEAHRRSMPYCMGTLYWQLNDSWPVISWSGLDYYGCWKALHYFARRAYQDVMICAVAENGKLKAFLVNDLQEDKTGRAEMKLMDFSGNVLTIDTLGTTAKKNSSVVFYSDELSMVLGSNDRSNVFVELLFIAEGDTLARNTWFFSAPKDMALPPGIIGFEVKEVKKEVKVFLLSDVLAKDVYLDFSGFEGRFSDNFFDLLPGESMLVTFFPGQRDHMPGQRDLKIFTLNDMLQP
jgi:beta-mannosidase